MKISWFWTKEAVFFKHFTDKINCENNLLNDNLKVNECSMQQDTVAVMESS